MDNRSLMVSVRCATYNHAPFIRQCLDGFVMQKTVFRFEVIVHDDASTDGTTDIVREYAEKYPDIIKPMYETENQYSKNQKAMDDAIDSRLMGKYIAICEGDDYWTDPLKLQKQFDFMESHPECSLCFHSDYKLFPSKKMIVRKPNVIKQFYTADDVISEGGAFIGTRTLFFHLKYFPSYDNRPEFWKKSIVGDLPLRLYLCTKGLAGYIDETMAVYRYKSSENAYSSRNESIKVWIRNLNNGIELYKSFDEYSCYNYHSSVKKVIWNSRWIIGPRGVLGAVKNRFLRFLSAK